MTIDANSPSDGRDGRVEAHKVACAKAVVRNVSFTCNAWHAKAEHAEPHFAGPTTRYRYRYTGTYIYTLVLSRPAKSLFGETTKVTVTVSYPKSLLGYIHYT